MTFEEYFGDWSIVIDKQESIKIIRWLNSISQEILCPSKKDIFKAFKLCSYKDCTQIWLGLDPYPQKGVATGVLFGNKEGTLENNLSPSLKIVKEAMINYNIPHYNIEFDNTMEFIANQGILLINSALTCEVNKVGSHSTIWKPFISKLLYNFSLNNPSTIFVLFGKQASSFKNNIVGKQHILECYHPSYYARMKDPMPKDIFLEINRLSKNLNGFNIKYFKEQNNEMEL